MTAAAITVKWNPIALTWQVWVAGKRAIPGATRWEVDGVPVPVAVDVAVDQAIERARKDRVMGHSSPLST